MKHVLRWSALIYVAVVLLVPVGFIFYKTFAPGPAEVWRSITTPAAIHPFWLTIGVAAIAVPLNAIFGVLIAVMLVRSRMPGKRFIEGILDLPFAVSPVVVGLALILVYGKDGWFGSVLADLGIQVIFSVPGIVIATIFVCVPFVAREVIPVLREIGTDQEQAASTLGATRWQSFSRLTLPSIRWGLVYGIVLSTARAIGEFGAVSVVGGRSSGKTETLTLLVENRFTNFNIAGAYAASALLAAIALFVLLVMTLLQRRREPS